jgi:hypothetical protein
MTQLNFGCIEPDNLAANTSQLRPVTPSAHASAVQYNLRVRERVIPNDRLPVASGPRIFEAGRQRHQQLAIVQLRFAGKIERLLEARTEGRFQLLKLRCVNPPRLRARRVR